MPHPNPFIREIPAAHTLSRHVRRLIVVCDVCEGLTVPCAACDDTGTQPGDGCCVCCADQYPHDLSNPERYTIALPGSRLCADCTEAGVDPAPYLREIPRRWAS